MNRLPGEELLWHEHRLLWLNGMTVIVASGKKTPNAKEISPMLEEYMSKTEYLNKLVNQSFSFRRVASDTPKQILS